MQTPHRLANRMSHISPFEVMEIQTLARQLEAQDHDVIHMEIGEPDFATPAPIVAAAQHAIGHRNTGYTSACGMMTLRQLIATHYQTAFGATIDPQRIIVTAGSSAALLLAFGVLLNRDDEVLMADPGYPCNRHFVRTMDGVPINIAVDALIDYQLTAAHVEQHWSSRTAATLIASPSNPTGTVVSDAELQKIYNATTARGGTLIVDEIYQGLTYDAKPTTALALDGVDNIFVINSFSKYFQMTGWRLGWMVVPSAYVRQIETLAQNLFISPSAPAQHAAHAAFMPETIAILEARREELRLRRDYLVPALRGLGWHIPVVPQGAFYLYADISSVAEDSFTLSRKILAEAHVALTPGRDFGNHQPEKHIRIAYTQPITRLQEAVERIKKMMRD
jgi:aspartate/methionine/tyrosine aminotransferase